MSSPVIILSKNYQLILDWINFTRRRVLGFKFCKGTKTRENYVVCFQFLPLKIKILKQHIVQLILNSYDEFIR